MVSNIQRKMAAEAGVAEQRVDLDTSLAVERLLARAGVDLAAAPASTLLMTASPFSDLLEKKLAKRRRDVEEDEEFDDEEEDDLDDEEDEEFDDEEDEEDEDEDFDEEEFEEEFEEEDLDEDDDIFYDEDEEE